MLITSDYIDFGGDVYLFSRIDALPQTKENAFLHHIAMDCRSWTFQRMTKAEQEKCINVLLWANQQGMIKGDFNTRFQTLNGLYHAFLSGLGYDGFDWRRSA